MILLFGGIRETNEAAQAFAQAGYQVLVSLATDVPLHIAPHVNIAVRRGRLSGDEMHALIESNGVRAVVNITHPYAVQVRQTAVSVANECGIPYFTYMRPGAVTSHKGVHFAADHQIAARIACDFRKPVLLTTGSRNIAPYTSEAHRQGITLVARVLSDNSSVQACLNAQLPREQIVTGRGPFSLEQNRSLIREFGIGVLVTKDSGEAGGVHEKLEAAKLENCDVVVVARPEAAECSCSTIDELARRAQGTLKRPLPVLALDLESILIPEIWETIARASGIDELAVTTRDVPDYQYLMEHRIRVCKQHGLTLSCLLEIVRMIEPLEGANNFLNWARDHFQTTIVSDTFSELSNPVTEKLNCPFVVCNSLSTDHEGYIDGYRLHHENGKTNAITRLKQKRTRVYAVGDSYNDIGMLETADFAIMFRPSESVLGNHSTFPTAWNYSELQSALNCAKEAI